MNLRQILLNLEKRDNLDLLYLNYKKQLLLFVLSIVKNYDIAEDVVEDVFLKIIKYHKSYNLLMNPKTWIYTICKNAAYTYLKNNNIVLYNNDDLYRELNKNNNIKNNDSLVVEEYLSYLDDLERNIVIMHIFGGLNHLEISKVLNMTHQQVRSKYSYSIKKLRKIVDKI